MLLRHRRSTIFSTTQFARPDLLAEALTHRSAVRRRGGAKRGYERLEFLGDRVLGLIVAELLWRRFPDEAEGELTRRHTHLVRREALAEVAMALGLGPRINVSRGEDARRRAPQPQRPGRCVRGGDRRALPRRRASAARHFVERWWEPRLAALAAPPRDPKTALQEWAQARGLPLPAYRTVATEGPAHRRRFTITVGVEGLPPATATGASKRAAETAAAAAALAALDDKA